MSSSTSEMPAITPHLTFRGHTNKVHGVVHLPGGRRIITCSLDGSLRLWDLESGTQIGEDWRDDDNAGEWSIALSPNGKTIASVSNDRKVKLWDVETRKVITKWAGHTDLVGALCWSADGNQVLSGSWDGTARVWNVESDKPDTTKIATGGWDENAVKIWDAKTGELFKRLEHHNQVWSLTWTSDEKKLITGSYGLIRIFDTATWKQIAVLEGHTSLVYSITLSGNERLLASASADKTGRLWNLDTNLPVGPPLQHKDKLECATLSPDGKVLVTGCHNKNAYTWDIHAILKEAGLEDLLEPLSDVAARESLMDVDATQAEDDELSPGFFNDVTYGAQPSRMHGNYHRSSAFHSRPLPSSLGSASALLGRLWLPFRHSYRKTGDATELQQRPRRSFIPRGPCIVEVAAVKDREVIFTAPPPPQKTQQQTQSHTQGSSTTQPAPDTNPITSRPRHPYSLPVRLLAHLVLFLCCASQHADANTQSTQQQQGQPQDQSHSQASSSQPQPAAPSTSATPIALDTRSTTPVGASV